MAPNARIMKVNLQLSDMDRHYYQNHTLTLAQHPSETDDRLMVRLLAFALNASEQLHFAKDLSGEGEAELLEQDLNGDILLWVAFGQSDEKWLRKACNRARAVKVYAYGGRAVPLWWQANESILARHANLQVWEIPEDAIKELRTLVNRSMRLQCTISEGQVWFTEDELSATIEPVLLKDFQD